MIIKDEAVLDRFRQAKKCEWCSKETPSGCDPHHISAKGMGGGKRVDIPENLVALCRADHTKAHAGFISQGELFEIAGKREGKSGEECQQLVWDIQLRKKS